jgi:hypothetical protein
VLQLIPSLIFIKTCPKKVGDVTLLCKVFTQWELSKNLQIVNMNKLDLIYIPFLIPVLAPSYAAKGCAIIYRPSTHSNAVAAVVGHVLEH